MELVTFRTAVAPAAGTGSRLLPTTKTVPEELLPVIDTPGIELVATKAARSGARRLLIVDVAGKDLVVAHFVDGCDLEERLEVQGKLLEKARRAPNLLSVESVVQDTPLNLGHAVGHVEGSLAPDEDAIAVLLPDDLVQPSGIRVLMARVRGNYGGSVLYAVDVPSRQVSSYGVFEVEKVPDAANPDVLRVRGMVDKPALADAPSTLAVGRYLLDRRVFKALRRIEPGAGGELQLTDAIVFLIEEGHPVHVVVHQGARHDLGNPGRYLQASVDAALNSEKYGDGLRKWLYEQLTLDSSDVD